MSNTAVQQPTTVDSDQPGEAWAPPQQEPANLKPADLERWRKATSQVRDLAARMGYSKAETSRRSEVPQGTFSPWYNGNYPGAVATVTAKIERWLVSMAEAQELAARLPQAPGFIETRTAKSVMAALLYAQTMPSMAIVILGAGCGKTVCADHYIQTRPHAYKVTMRPTTGSVHGMLLALADSLGVVERNPARLDTAIGERLKRNGRNTLLLVDEAQNLTDNAVNELRYLLDAFGCGLGLLGNEELYTRLGGEKPTPAFAQIHRRIGMRVRQLQPHEEDIAALVAAWGITDPAAVKLAMAIGHKPGALSQISQTLMLAGQIAAGRERAVTADDVKAAWRNRGGEAI